MMSELDPIVPLDIRLLRKTQRRVAALLRSARDAGSQFPIKQKRSSLTHGRRQVGGKQDYILRQDEDKWGQYPRPPNPSAASRDSHGFDQHEDIRHMLNTLKASSIQRDNHTDGGRYNCQYNDHQQQQHLPPLLDDTGRSGSLAKCNQGTQISNRDVAAPLKLPEVDAHRRHNVTQSGGGAIEIRTRLPDIDKNGSLVAGSRGVSDPEDRHIYKGSYSERRLSPMKESAVERNFSFVSERTGGSLRIDEDYVPMSVTITKLSDGDLERERTFDHSGIASSHYNSWSSDKSKPLLDLNRAAPKKFAEPAYIRNHDSPSSPESFLVHRESSSWCTCSGDKTSVASTPCPECRGIGVHERWCVSASGLCQLCRKPVKRFGRRHRQKPGDLRDTRGSGGGADPDDGQETDFRRTRKHASKTDREQQRALRETFERELNHASPDRAQNQRLRFDPIDSMNNSAITAHDAENEHSSTTGPDSKDVAQRDKKKQNVLGETNAKQPSEKNSVKIPQLGVSVHKTAYILALRDSMEQKKNRKPKFREKKKLKESSESEGTVFSYFTLLRRPYSDPVHSLNLGIKQNFGVMPKNGMKHVFGKIKLADYYPGGKRWKELYGDT